MSKKLLVIIPAILLIAAAKADSPSPKSDAQTKQLLQLMDTDQNGKVSRDEFMKFMAAEFDRLDVNKDGELDVKELTALQVRAARHTGGAGSK